MYVFSKIVTFNNWGDKTVNNAYNQYVYVEEGGKLVRKRINFSANSIEDLGDALDSYRESFIDPKFRNFDIEPLRPEEALVHVSNISDFIPDTLYEKHSIVIVAEDNYLYMYRAKDEITPHIFDKEEWEFLGAVNHGNIDGGAPDSVYLASQSIDCGYERL